MEEKVIFLDIDGVLNDSRTDSYIYGTRIIGVDRKKLILLKRIVRATSAKIVLVSTWKEGWYADGKDKWRQDEGAEYLDEFFAKYGMKISDKTSRQSFDRGLGIKEYLEQHPVSSWCIIDDEVFMDYDDFIMKHLVKTDWKTGLTEGMVAQAIKLLTV